MIHTIGPRFGVVNVITRMSFPTPRRETLVATMLVHYPQKVDAFLNSDEPVQSKHVVTSSK